MKIAKLFIAGLALAGLTAAASAGSLDDITKRGELRVAVQTQGPPFSLVGANGERTGSSVELAELMAKEMGVKITFLDFQRCLGGQGPVDGLSGRHLHNHAGPPLEGAACLRHPL
ncbi:transporter substrate-binding domain-containing protein [Mesorhizobium sp. B2-4-1]|uniref:transporter substrate-binding domain-containing protein n=1 Tax=Mesorhizobium sp. B2-4-1 TaxID=2589948 RepID=UPI0032B2D3D4